MGTTRDVFVQIISTNPLIQVPPKIPCLSWKCTLNAQPKLYIRVQLAVSRALKSGIFLPKRSISVIGRQRMQPAIEWSEGTIKGIEQSAD